MYVCMYLGILFLLGACWRRASIHFNQFVQIRPLSPTTTFAAITTTLYPRSALETEDKQTDQTDSRFSGLTDSRPKLAWS